MQSPVPSLEDHSSSHVLVSRLSSMGLVARWLLGVCMVMVSVKTSPGQQPRAAGCPCPKLSNHICSASEVVGMFWINQEVDTFLWSGLVVWR